MRDPPKQSLSIDGSPNGPAARKLAAIGEHKPGHRALTFAPDFALRGTADRRDHQRAVFALGHPVSGEAFTQFHG